jgi:nicotine blue oxidoreductase
MGSSLRAGLEHLSSTDSDRVLVTLVDLPGLTAEACLRVLASPADVAAATYDGVRGHPVAFTRMHWQAIIDSAEGDAGARAFLQRRRDVELVEVADVADGQDLDSPISD